MHNVAMRDETKLTVHIATQLQRSDVHKMRFTMECAELMGSTFIRIRSYARKRGLGSAANRPVGSVARARSNLRV